LCAVANTPRVASTGLVTASYGTFVYQLDGSASGAPPTTARQWKYATLTDTWVSIKAIPSTRLGGASGVATVGTKMYVFDGPIIPAAPGNKKNEAYDTPTDTWTTKVSTPSDHAKGAVGVKSNKIYVAGGPVTNKLEIYDAAADSWTSGTALARPSRRSTLPRMRCSGLCSFRCRFRLGIGLAGANFPDSTLRMGLKGSVIGNLWYVSGGSNAPLMPGKLLGADMITYKYTLTTSAWTTSARPRRV
jgi:hypothetical protein